MTPRRIRYEIEPMTLGNMRELGVRSLDLSCWNCHHQGVLLADHWPDRIAAPTFGPRMVCTGCEIVGADATPMLPQRTCGGLSARKSELL
jgi:hypothetical protein